MVKQPENPQVKELLSSVEQEALQELKRRLIDQFPFIEELILFGSVVRGEADEESDVDLLVLTNRKLDRSRRHEITGVVFKVNLEYDTNFSALVADRENWDSGVVSVLPIHTEIEQHGVPV